MITAKQNNRLQQLHIYENYSCNANLPICDSPPMASHKTTVDIFLIYRISINYSYNFKNLTKFYLFSIFYSFFLCNGKYIKFFWIYLAHLCACTICRTKDIQPMLNFLPCLCKHIHWNSSNSFRFSVL